MNKPSLIYRVKDRTQFVNGFVAGLQQSGIIYEVRYTHKFQIEPIKLLVRYTNSIFTDSQNVASFSSDVAQFLNYFVKHILEKSGQHVRHDTVIISTFAANDLTCRLIMQPCFSQIACLAAVDLAIDLLNTAAENFDRAPWPELVSLFDGELEAAAPRLQTGRPHGFNTKHFLEAASDLDVPCLRVAPQVLQFGFGSAARLLDSSFTDRTSYMGARAARDKKAAAQWLARSGIPVPEQREAKSADQAIAAAQQLGYPVVVKPADLDGGVGVSTSLIDAASVSRAFDLARQHSKRIIVERHHEGKDYRIQIVDGQVFAIIERQPGGVVGNGSDTIIDLINKQNVERAEAVDDRRYLHAINVDDELHYFLEQQCLTLEDVAKLGQFVRLRGPANIATGGMPTVIATSMAHPDNVALALRACRVLRIDVAGVDLLIPDIAASWLETGAVICEVNAQPQMFTTLHRPTLKHLLGPSRGRIPTVLVAAGGPYAGLLTQLHQQLMVYWPSCARHDTTGALIGQSKVLAAGSKFTPAVQMLLKDPAVDALVAEVPLAQPVWEWPIDRVDIVIMLGTEGLSADNPNHFNAICRNLAFLRPRHLIGISGDRQFAKITKFFSPSTEAHTVAPGQTRSDIFDQLSSFTLSKLISMHK